MPRYAVVYAKIVETKEDGIILDGVYFYCIHDTMPDAETAARKCVNIVRGGTIIPKIMEVPGNETLIDVMYEATDRFESLVLNMVHANRIMSRKRKK